MKEKLLALLVAKFAGVPEATLERIATKKAGSITDESQLQSVVDGIDYGQIVQSEVDSKITEANKKAVQNYETVHKLKDGKPVEAEPDPNPGKGGDDIAAIIANALKPLQEKLSAFEGGKIKETRLQQFSSKLNDLPESFKKQKLEDFELMNFESDEKFNEYLAKLDTGISEFKQEMANMSLGNLSKPFISTGANDEDSFVNSMKTINETKTEN